MLARTPKPRVLALIDAAVAQLPPVPSFGPLPDQRTGKYHDAPCATPKARFGIAGVGNPCICGSEVGEHPRPAMAQDGPVYAPQGYCPKPWVARVRGNILADARGGALRFKTEEAARKAVAVNLKETAE